MAFLVSPGVQVNEVDLTNVVPAVATSIGAIAGPFEKGPVNSIADISSEEQLVKTFGKPNASNFEWWFTAANFLHYSDSLKVVRAGSLDTLKNAVVSGTAVLIRDTDHYTAEYSSGSNSVGSWAARTAGTWGNSIGVSICPTAQAYEQHLGSNNLVNDSSVSIGDTTIVVDDVDASGYAINVGDMISFSSADSSSNIENFTHITGDEGNEYEVTAVDTSTNTVTFRLKDDPNGDGLAVAVSDNSFIRRRWRFADLFRQTDARKERDATSGKYSKRKPGPGTSEWATQNNRGVNDELHVVVYDTTGDITGFDVDAAGQRSNAVIETFDGMSKNPSAKTPQGSNNYYPDVIYRSSEYIYWMDHPSAGINWGSDVDGTQGSLLLDGTDSSSTDAGDNVVLDASASAQEDMNDNITLEDGTKGYSAVDTPTKTELASGADHYAVTAGQLEIGYDRFDDPENVDVNLVLGARGGGAGDTRLTLDTHVTMITDLVEKRRDCVGFVSPHRGATVGVAERRTQTENVKNAFDLCPSSSYMVFDSGYKYMYDKYNDVYRFVPLNGDTAGLCAFTDRVADAWFSPGGYNRGNVRGAIKLSYNPNKADRDILYTSRINPVVNFPGQGVVLFGDKTALSKPSAFDRINVRRLFLVMEKAIATAAKFQLFEFNDEFTRAQFRSLVEPFLRDVQGRRGITDFSVVCDASNNTGEVIDRNEFVADIFVKPARAINFISLNFIATRTGVAFSEVQG